MNDDSENSFAIYRALKQQFESWELAGITHWAPPDPNQVAQLLEQLQVVPSASPENRLPAKQAPSSRPDPAPTVHPRTPSTPEPSESDLMKRQSLKILPPTTAPEDFQPLDLPLDERISRLAEVQKQVAQCRLCPELAETRTQTVFGVGNPQAKILFIGEAPGADEDRLGEPFVGRAGQLLNDIIKACRLNREDLYICNVLRCRPPGNRLPAPQEASNCRQYLDAQIAIVNPDYIVCWGSCAAQNLLAKQVPIGKLRGQFFRYGRAKVLCTYHPSYLLRNPPAKKDVWADMKFLFQDQGITLK